MPISINMYVEIMQCKAHAYGHMKSKAEKLNNKLLFFQIKTPPKMYLDSDYLTESKFYRNPLFLLALAAVSIVIIIVVVAILCVKSKSYKYKGKYFSPPLFCNDQYVTK